MKFSSDEKILLGSQHNPVILCAELSLSLAFPSAPHHRCPLALPDNADLRLTHRDAMTYNKKYIFALLAISGTELLTPLELHKRSER